MQRGLEGFLHAANYAPLLERLHQEAIARYFLFHSDFQLNRPQIKKTVTKFQSSQKHNIPQWQSNKIK